MLNTNTNTETPTATTAINISDPREMRAFFEALKPGQTITISFASCMATSRGGLCFRVGRRSYSRKYEVHTIRLVPSGHRAGAPFKLYMRATGVTMAHGNMGVQIRSITI